MPIQVALITVENINVQIGTIGIIVTAAFIGTYLVYKYKQEQSSEQEELPVHQRRYKSRTVFRGYANPNAGTYTSTPPNPHVSPVNPSREGTSVRPRLDTRRIVRAAAAEEAARRRHGRSYSGGMASHATAYAASEYGAGG